MTLTRTTRLVMAALAASALAFAGCGKEKKDAAKEGASGEQAGAPAAGAAATAPGGAAPAGDIKKALSYLPGNSKYVFGINPKDLQKNQQIAALLPMAMAQSPELQQFQAKCGLNPLTAFDSIVVGGDQDKPFVVLNGIPRDDFNKCAAELAKGEEGAKVDQDGKFTVIHSQDGDEMILYWVESNVAYGGKDWSRADLESHKGGLAQNQKATELLRNVDTSGGIWFVAAEGGDLPWNAEGAFGTLSFANGIKIDLGARMPNGDAAKSKVDEFTTQMGALPASPVIDQLKQKLVFKANDRDLIAQLNLSNQELQQLFMAAQNDPMMQQLMMGMMGGMGGMR